MRFSALLFAALIGIAIPASAQEREIIKHEDIAALESAGTINDIAAGAFEKTLWRDNSRNDIIKGLQSLPPESPLRSVHDLKRRIMLSRTDATLIDNDGPATSFENLFIQRILKLQEMGLYEDALKLYTDNIDTPNDAILAETGLTLITHQRGLATACLEEKVLAPEFEGDAFFAQMDALCSFELGQTDTPPALESLTLQAITKEEGYKVSARDIPTLYNLTPLELAVLKSEARIDYKSFETTPAALTPYPARVLTTFLEDKTLPAERLLPLQVELARRGYLSVKKLPVWKEAHILEVDVKDKAKTDAGAADAIFWKGFTPLLQNEQEIVNLTPYGKLLSERNPRVTGPLLTKSLAVIMASGNEIPAPWCNALLAEKTDQATVYYQTLTFLQVCEPNSDKAVDNLTSALGAFPPEQNAKLWIIMGLLAPKTEAYGSILQIYEKHFPLTGQNDYVMHTQDKPDESRKDAESGGFGVALLRTLALVKGETGENINPPVLQITVKGLLDEGLENDARQLAKEVFVGILLNNKNLGENKNG